MKHEVRITWESHWGYASLAAALDNPEEVEALRKGAELYVESHWDRDATNVVATLLAADWCRVCPLIQIMQLLADPASYSQGERRTILLHPMRVAQAALAQLEAQKP